MRGSRTTMPSPSRYSALTVPDEEMRTIGSAAHSGNWAATNRRTSATSVWSSSACILRSAKPTPSCVRPSTRRLVTAHRLVSGEARLEHALAARQSRQVPLEVMRAGRRQDRLDRGELPLQRLGLDGTTEPRQCRDDRPDGVHRDLEADSDDGLADDRPGPLERLHEDERRELSEVGGRAQRSAPRWRAVRNAVGAPGQRHAAVRDLPAEETLLQRLPDVLAHAL